MPSPVNNRKGEEWRRCGRCGFLFPISQLSVQKGMYVDGKCRDSLRVEIRPKIIADVLKTPEGLSTADQELRAGGDEDLRF